MKRFFQKYKIEIFLFLASLVLGLAVFSALSAWENKVGNFSDSDYSFPVMADDSPGYYELARNIIDQGRFVSVDDKSFPESFRTPGYPLFIAGVLLIFNNNNLISFIQIILAALSVVWLYKIARLFFDKKIAIGASLLLLLEPSAIYYANLVLSDSLFVFLLLLLIWFFVRSPKSASQELWFKFLAGLILGLATLVRPIGQYLFFILLLYFIVYYFKKFNKQKFIAIILFILGVALVVSPWMIRNKKLFDTWEISSASGLVLYNYTLPMHYAQANDMTLDEARQIFDKQSNKTGNQGYDMSLFLTSELKNKSLKYLQDNFGSYLKFHLIKTIPIFFTDGLRDILYQIKANTSGMPNISSYIMHGQFGELASNLLKSKLNISLFFGGVLAWTIINLAALWGFIRLLFNSPKKRFYFIILSAILILYFSLVTGPIANSRYRLPFEPFVFILASYGFSKKKHE